MMKRHCRLDHRLEKQFFLWTNFAHPTLFPRIVRRMKFARVVKIDPGDVLNRIRRDVSIEIRRSRIQSSAISASRVRVERQSL